MRGQPSEEPVSGQETGIEWSQMLAAARENWSPAQIVREKKGRPTKEVLVLALADGPATGFRSGRIALGAPV